jgi:hypothetical protein
LGHNIKSTIKRSRSYDIADYQLDDPAAIPAAAFQFQPAAHPHILPHQTN